MVGFPRTIRALYVDQLEVSEECSSVLEVVMSADKEVVLWRRQAQQLQVQSPHTVASRTITPFYSPPSLYWTGPMR